MSVFRVAEPVTVHRVVGGTAENRGRFMAFELPTSRQRTLDELALPEGNTAEAFISFSLPPDLVVAIGRVEEIPERGLSGGGTQVFVENDILDRILAFNGVSSWDDFERIPLPD